MIKLFAIAFLFFYVLQSCKNTSQTLEEAVNGMSEYKSYEEKFVGLTAEPSLQWARYETLLAKSTESELVNLCENESPVVRSYSFQALVAKNSSKVFGVLTKHIHDTAAFERTMGCFGGESYVTDFYLEQVGYFPYDSSVYFFTKEQRIFIDSLMIFGSEMKLRMSNYNRILLNSRRHLLKHLTRRDIYYNRLREIVLAGAIEALPALAKFKNQNDISIIKTVSENEGLIGEDFVFDAIINFPHPDLFPIVEESVKNDLIHDNEFEYREYKALVQYKTPKTLKLLEEALLKFSNQNQKREINNIKFLVEEYPDKIFDGLFK
jgi:hypothetical protein